MKGIDKRRGLRMRADSVNEVLGTRRIVTEFLPMRDPHAVTLHFGEGLNRTFLTFEEAHTWLDGFAAFHTAMERPCPKVRDAS